MVRTRNLWLALLLGLNLTFCTSPAQVPAPAFEARTASASDDACLAGKRIMAAGGNAVDAAIAMQFALAVTYPDAGNLGGGGFMVIRMNDGTTASLDFREVAPSRSSRDMFLDSRGNVVVGLSLEDRLSAGVPGTVDGMVKAHEKYGSLPWATLVQPAINLAENGFVLNERDAASLNSMALQFQRVNPGKRYLLKAAGWRAGDTLRQPDLAETLRRIRDLGRAGFYEGKTASLIVAEMQRGNGIINTEDLKQYESKWRTPVTGKYKEYELITMGPPSSGGICLLQMLKMAEEFPLRDWGFHSEKSVHTLIEIQRRVYADRSQHLGDADFYEVNIRGLLDPVYLRQRASTIDVRGRATPSRSVSAGLLPEPAPEPEETTHFSVVDGNGNAVAVTTTLNSAYGSAVFVGGAGFLLNNEMDDFSSKPGEPNQFGLVGNEANAIAPGKRMLSAMTPAIATRNGKLFLVWGSPGGSTIITTVLQVFLNMAEWDMDLKAAVDAPRIHSQWLPDFVYLEHDALPPNVVSALEARGHALRVRPLIGAVDAVWVSEEGKTVGVADWRRGGSVR